MPWRTLDPADELIFLAAHAAKHRFERLIWLVDLALFADRLSPAGWLDTARRAKAAKAGPVLALTLSLLRELLAADVPTPEALGLSLGGVSARLAHAACARAWLDPDPHGLAGRVVKASAHFALCQDLPALARDASGSLARPVLRLLAAVADRSSER